VFLLKQALGPHALLAVQLGRLRIEPYQLVPVVQALPMSRVRLLLGDGAGLGKTIQAGLVITELMARRVAHRILVVSPAGPLPEQWRLKMAQRFGLGLEVIDRGRLEEVRCSTELGANPFEHLSLGLASIDLLKQERVLDQLERTSYDVQSSPQHPLHQCGVNSTLSAIHELNGPPELHSAENECLNT
jgi:SNF2 family DNA or RNA helicase